MFVFCFLYSAFLYFLLIVSPFAYSCLFSIFLQVYRPLPPGGNPVAVNKYQIIPDHIYHIITEVTKKSKYYS
jgi:hypothetical protein